MRSKLFILVGMVVLSLAASCTKQDPAGEPGLTPPDATGMSPILFSVGSPMRSSYGTKATEVTTANLNAFYVTATTGTVGSSESAVFASALFSGTPGGDYSGGKYWPSTAVAYHFYASNVAHSFAGNNCTVAATNATDVIAAYVASPVYKASTALTFDHVFAQVGTCTVSAPSGYTISDVVVRMTPKTGGTYNIRTKAWSGVTTGSELTLSASANGLYCVPGTYDLTVSYRLTMGGYVGDFTKPAQVTLTAGKVCNISAVAPDGGANEITFTVSLAAWAQQNTSVDFE